MKQIQSTKFMIIFLLSVLFSSYSKSADDKDKKLLLDTNKCIDCDLTDLELNNRDLKEINLTSSDAKRISLKLSDMTEAKLINVDLKDGNLTATVLHLARLMKSDLRRVNFKDADLSKANMRRAKLGGAIFDGTDLSGAALDKSKGLVQSQLDKACGDNETSLPPGLSIPLCTEATSGNPSQEFYGKNGELQP